MTSAYKIKVKCAVCGKIGIDFQDREKAVGFGLYHHERSGHGVKVTVESVIFNWGPKS